MKITSLQNPKVKYWVSLKNKKVRDQEKVFLIEGDHLVKKAKDLNLIKEEISLSDPNADYYVTKDIMQKISSQVSISDVAAVVEYQKEKEVKGNVLILDGLQDPGNLGTIIRSSLAFNFPNIILSLDSVDLYNPKVIRATEGMLFETNVLRKDLTFYLPQLKKAGYKIIGTDVKRGQDIKLISQEKIALVIGSKGQGISPKIKELCDDFVYLKMNSKVESLNASVAASILMYEVNHD